MAKRYIASIVILLAFNFLYKGVRYFMYDGADGEVMRHESVLIHYTKNNQGKIENHQKWVSAPEIVFMSGDEELSFYLADLDMVEFLDDGDEVTVLYDRAKGEYNVATIVNYWLTFYDVALGLVLALVGPVAFAIFKAIKKGLAAKA